MFCDFTSFPGVGGANSGAAASSEPTARRAAVVKNVNALAHAGGRASGGGALPSSSPEDRADIWDVPSSNGGCADGVDLSMAVAFGAGGCVTGGQPTPESVCPTPLLAPRPAVAAASPVTPASVMSDVFRVPAIGGQDSPPCDVAPAGGRGGATSTSTANTAVGGAAAGGARCAAPMPKRKITRKRPRKSEAAAEAARWAPAIASQDLAGTTAAASRRMSTEERQLMLHKRKLRNRASAARSRAVARTVVADVVGEVAALETAVSAVGARVEGVVSANAELRRENAQLRAMVGMLRQTVQAQGGSAVTAGLFGGNSSGPSSSGEMVKVDLPSQVNGMPSTLAREKDLMPVAGVHRGTLLSANPPAVTVVTAPPPRVSRTAPPSLSPASSVTPPATADCRALPLDSANGPQLVGVACPPLAPVVVASAMSQDSAAPQRSCAPLVPSPPPLRPSAAPPSSAATTPAPTESNTATPLLPNQPEATALVSTGAYQYEDDALLPPELLEQLALSVDQAPTEAEVGANLRSTGGAVVDAKQETVPVPATASDASGAYPPGLPFSASTASLDTLFASLADGGPRPFSLPRTASMLRMYTWTA